jgi:hypothetical protein
VNSQPTVDLITRAVGEGKSQPDIGRAEAMRRSMLAMIGSGDPQFAHPSNWAPFIVVGEGGPAAAAPAPKPNAESPSASAPPASKPATRKKPASHGDPDWGTKILR